MTRYLPIVVVVGLLAADGYVHGLWTNRWQTTSHLLESAIARIEAVPMAFGDWEGEAMKPFSERIVEQAGFAGYISRRYTNRQNNSAVTILLACGRPGPLAVHTPDVCYRGSGYETAKTIKKHSEKSGDVTVEMWKAHFVKPNAATPMQLQVLWSWNAGASWQAPDNARFAFAGNPVLHKLYVIQEFNGNDEQSGKTCSEFLSQFIPELNRKLFDKS